MQPLHVVYMLNANLEYTTELAQEITQRGHSRIPVYENDPSLITVILFVKWTD